MIYGIELILLGLVIWYLLARDKRSRAYSAHVRPYDSFERFRNNVLLRAAARLLGLISVIVGMLLLGYFLVNHSGE